MIFNNFWKKYPEGLTLPEQFVNLLGYTKKLDEGLDSKTDRTGNHQGSWQGLDRPTLSEEGMRSTVEQQIKLIDNIGLQLTKFPMLTGETDDTNRINRMLSEGRGKHLFIPAGEYVISSSLIIYDNTTLSLDDNAIIKMKNNTVIKENTNNWFGTHMIKNDLTEGINNITVEGGIWDGQGLTQAQDSFRGLRFENVDGLILRNLKVKEVNGWAICHVNCKNFHFYNIDITQQYSDTLYNYDGITGTSTNGTIENIDCYAGDDTIALYAGNPLFETKQDIENVIIRNIRMKDNKNLSCYTGIALYATNNYTMKNVIVENVTGNTRRYMVKVMNFNPEYGDGYFDNITFKNIVGNSKTTHPILIKACKIGNIVFDGYSRNYEQSYTLDYGYMCYVFPDTYIDTITFNNINNLINKSGVNQALLRDEGYINNVILNNIVSMNTVENNTTVVYHKAGLSTEVTEVSGNNIARIGKTSANINFTFNNQAKGRIRGYDFIGATNNLEPKEGDYLTIINEGLHEFKNGQWSIPIGYFSVNSTTWTMDKMYDVVSVDTSSSPYNIELPNTFKKKGYSFYLRIPFYVNPITFTNNGTNIFVDRTFSVGTFLIYCTGSNFMCVKLSEDILTV